MLSSPVGNHHHIAPLKYVTKPFRVGSEVTELTLPATFTDLMGPHIRLDLQDFALSLPEL